MIKKATNVTQKKQLKTYRAKRHFNLTPEPAGGKYKKSFTPLIFVIQKHEASHLHYDFRLEMNGVLKSWAVPKGPSLNPNNKRLAVQVEDHPIEYGSFEGIIPQGHYGGGTVMIWDGGQWICQDKSPQDALASGHITFTLTGKRLKGLWSLIQFNDNPKNWLLVKMKDRFARFGTEITDQKTKSIVSNMSMTQIAEKHQNKKR